jgi:hypothetical protein
MARKPQPPVPKQIISIRANGGITVLPLKQLPTLEQLQTAIGGGCIELVPYFTTYGVDQLPCIAFCDENGKLTNQRMNVMATGLWRRAVGKPLNDYLVGSICIVTGPRNWLANM